MMLSIWGNVLKWYTCIASCSPDDPDSFINFTSYFTTLSDKDVKSEEFVYQYLLMYSDIDLHFGQQDSITMTT